MTSNNYKAYDLLKMLSHKVSEAPVHLYGIRLQGDNFSLLYALSFVQFSKALTRRCNAKLKKFLSLPC